MNKVDEIEKQLNRMFQFIFKEDKRYIFIEDDVKGFIDINVADEKAYAYIIKDKSRFHTLVNDYLDIHDVRVRKYKGTIPDLTEKPQTLKEEVVVTKIIKQYVKQRVFVAKKIKVYLEKPVTVTKPSFEGKQEVQKLLNDMKDKLFKLRDNASERNKNNPSVNEDFFLAGTYLTVAEAYSYIQEIEKLLTEAKEPKAEKETVKLIEKFMTKEYEKLKKENLKIAEKHQDDDGSLYENILWADNWGQINFLGKLYDYLRKIEED